MPLGDGHLKIHRSVMSLLPLDGPSRKPGFVISLVTFLLTQPYSADVVCCPSMARKTARRNGDRSLYYRTAEVASILGISTRTLFRKLKSGEFPEPRRDPTNNYRVWTISEIEHLNTLMKG
jgi:predicted DNA-binding transcriptional regulator AlpA